MGGGIWGALHVQQSLSSEVESHACDVHYHRSVSEARRRMMRLRLYVCVMRLTGRICLFGEGYIGTNTIAPQPHDIFYGFSHFMVTLHPVHVLEKKRFIIK